VDGVNAAWRLFSPRFAGLLAADRRVMRRDSRGSLSASPPSRTHHTPVAGVLNPPAGEAAGRFSAKKRGGALRTRRITLARTRVMAAEIPLSRVWTYIWEPWLSPRRARCLWHGRRVRKESGGRSFRASITSHVSIWGALDAPPPREGLGVGYPSSIGSVFDGLRFASSLERPNDLLGRRWFPPDRDRANSARACARGETQVPNTDVNRPSTIGSCLEPVHYNRGLFRATRRVALVCAIGTVFRMPWSSSGSPLSS